MKKLYFKDGFITREEINYLIKESTNKKLISITGIEGYTKTLNDIKESADYFSNIPYLLNEFWCDETQQHEIYFLINGKAVHIQQLTEKELRKGHNIERMFRNGGFVMVERVRENG